MIFKKYKLKIQTSILKKNSKMVVKFFQKPIRNVNLFISDFLINSNQSTLENKIKFNKKKLTITQLSNINSLQKKKSFKQNFKKIFDLCWKQILLSKNE